MDLRKLKTLIELVESSGIAELEISEGEERVRITRSLASVQQGLAPAAQTIIANASPHSQTATPAAEPAKPAALEGHVVKSPMVGTFYRSASPRIQGICRCGAVCEQRRDCLHHRSDEAAQ